MTEFERFKSLFIQQSIHTVDYLNMLKEEHWITIPRDSESLFLGMRVNKITIGTLVRHFIIAEQNWIKAVAELPNGSVIPIPGNAALLEKVKEGKELIAFYLDALEENKKTLSSLKADDLEKEFTFAGRHYSGMGILWAMFGHHAYHLGQLDLIMRQSNLIAPEYMEWSEAGKVVA
ncbi:MAG: DinB family protein [Cyclobacteriaceae bacterium]